MILHGVDVYDPNTGEIRSNDTDQIALWMIDTAYNEESFFVRHCYFTGGQDPYARLKRALKADIDEDAWASLYRTESRPFPRPETGKIAVKVINDYGDEVMKVFDRLTRQPSALGRTRRWSVPRSGGTAAQGWGGSRGRGCGRRPRDTSPRPG